MQAPHTRTVVTRVFHWARLQLHTVTPYTTTDDGRAARCRLTRIHSFDIACCYWQCTTQSLVERSFPACSLPDVCNSDTHRSLSTTSSV